MFHFPTFLVRRPAFLLKAGFFVRRAGVPVLSGSRGFLEEVLLENQKGEGS
jgi:hypothetical protein